MELTVRRAQIEDIPRISDLLSQVCMVHHIGRPDLFKVGRKYNEEQLKEILVDDKTPVFAAFDENNYLLGYAFCVEKQFLNDNVLTDIKTLYIDDICVEETARGMHVGKTVYEYVKNWAKENDFYNITLNVWECNPGAVKFYQSMGLVPQKYGMETILK